MNVEVAVQTDVRGASPPSANGLVRLVDPAISSYGISARAVEPGALVSHLQITGDTNE